MAIRRKSFFLTLTKTQHNLKFSEFLLKNGFINSFNITSDNSKKTIVLFLKYGTDQLPAISSYSYAPKLIHSLPVISKNKNNKDYNFIVNLISKNKKHNILLGRFR
jgi:hypothetical protein